MKNKHKRVFKKFKDVKEFQQTAYQTVNLKDNWFVCGDNFILSPDVVLTKISSMVRTGKYILIIGSDFNFSFLKVGIIVRYKNGIFIDPSVSF
jgi:predicted transglutaminase-like protease